MVLCMTWMSQLGKYQLIVQARYLFYGASPGLGHGSCFSLLAFYLLTSTLVALGYGLLDSNPTPPPGAELLPQGLYPSFVPHIGNTIIVQLCMFVQLQLPFFFGRAVSWRLISLGIYTSIVYPFLRHTLEMGVKFCSVQLPGQQEANLQAG